MAWLPPSSTLCVETPFDSLRPREVLHECYGPLIFTTVTLTGEMSLAYVIDVSDEEARFRLLLVPLSQSQLDYLKAGVLTIYAVLDQPDILVVDYAFNGAIRRVWRLDDRAVIPESCLPKKDRVIETYLTPAQKLAQKQVH